MKLKSALSFLLLASATLGGCYKTAVRTPQPPGLPKHSDRQSFLLAGLVPLSGPAGEECSEGLTHVNSSYNGIDFLISLGVGAGGALLGAGICDSSDSAKYSACISTAGNAAALLFATRTVEYSCREATPANFGAFGPQLPPQGTYTPAPPAAYPAPAQNPQTYPAPAAPYPQQPAPQPYPAPSAPTAPTAPTAPQQPYPSQPPPQPNPAPLPQ